MQEFGEILAGALFVSVGVAEGGGKAVAGGGRERFRGHARIVRFAEALHGGAQVAELPRIAAAGAAIEQMQSIRESLKAGEAFVGGA